jgi:hypothetical protein
VARALSDRVRGLDVRSTVRRSPNVLYPLARVGRPLGARWRPLNEFGAVRRVKFALKGVKVFVRDGRLVYEYGNTFNVYKATPLLYWES